MEKKKKGGQPGNKNAVGHGAPFGNKNAVGFGAPYGSKNATKHGLFTNPYVYIPPTPVNQIVFQKMIDDDIEMTVDNFNAYKKAMKPEIREYIRTEHNSNVES